MMKAEDDEDGGGGITDFVKALLPQAFQDTILIVGQLVSGISTLAVGLLKVAAAEELETPKDVETALGVAENVSKYSNSISSIFITSEDIDNDTVNAFATWTGRIQTAISLVLKVAPTGIAKYKGITDKKGKKALTDKTEFVSAGVDAFFALLAFIPSGWHFYELAGKNADPPVIYAILDETTNTADNLNTINGFLLKYDLEPDTKVLLTATEVALIGVTGIVHIATGIYKATDM